MEQGKRKLTLKDIIMGFNPDSNAVLISNMQDDNGNASLFKLIIDPNEPFIRQKVGNYERTFF
jgi:hypothetical protein